MDGTMLPANKEKGYRKVALFFIECGSENSGSLKNRHNLFAAVVKVIYLYFIFQNQPLLMLYAISKPS